MLDIEVSFYTLPEYYPMPRSSGATLLTELIIKHNSYIKFSDYQVPHKASQRINKKMLALYGAPQGENRITLCFRSFDENTAKVVWATPLPCLSKGNVKK